MKQQNSIPTQLQADDKSSPADKNQYATSHFSSASIDITGIVLLDRYLIQKRIGNGGFGSIFLALDQRLVDKPVVVKILERMENEWVVQKFEQEREALARIEHSGVVGILDAGTLASGHPFIVMQYVDGITLHEIMDDQKLSIERIGTITIQTALALKAAHQKDILHRDLKPENIMLQKDNAGQEQVKVIDFGIAKVDKSKVAASTVGLFSAGTMSYLTPETLQGQPYSKRSDIYVLGIIVYEMLMGFRPFQPDTDNPLLFPPILLDLQKEPFPAPYEIRPDLPLEAGKVLLKALAFDPADRFQNIDEFGHSFVNALKPDINKIEKTQFFAEPVSEPKFQAEALTVSVIDNETIPSSASKRNSKKTRFIFFAVMASLATLLLVVSGIWYLSQRSLNSATENAASNSKNAGEPEISLRYWLMVQKIRNGKTYQEPFKSSGQEIFENGYEFTIYLSSAKKGYLYFFNEGINEDSGNFWILFPTPARNAGKAEIEANEEVKSGWNVFSGKAGTEKFWLIWTEEEVGLLEDARKNAFNSKDGAISNNAIKEKFEEFLASHSNQNLTVDKDEEDKETVIGGTGKVIVKQLKMEHR